MPPAETIALSRSEWHAVRDLLDRADARKDGPLRRIASIFRAPAKERRGPAAEADLVDAVSAFVCGARSRSRDEEYGARLVELGLSSMQVAAIASLSS
ncbi:MAG TPA: hypothetical protein VN034_08830 [Sphingopyxis sp.]|nr:hypothetical protein [Sphingopyxis sp.]HWU95279.1 hypothetical protein [Sphingomonas sp.]HWV60744.1 hypothetical protein [Sphingopyxis sp.]